MRSSPLTERLLEVVEHLEENGVVPVLVGGMALVVLGSTRTTRDFDLAVADREEVRRASVTALYRRGFHLVSKWDDENYRPVRVIDNENVAKARVVMDDEVAAFFWNEAVRMRIDLVFRTGIPAEELVERAVATPLPGGGRLLRASVKDLERMKRASLRADPARVADRQDLVYLRSLRRKRSAS